MASNDSHRKVSDEATVTNDTRRLIMTACSVVKWNINVSTGKRNSAPPNPINPPKMPINAPQKNGRNSLFIVYIT